jgi:hypothetical protein
MKCLLAALALVLTVSSSRALDVVFTFTGIALAGEPGETLGYNEGDIVMFQLVMNGSVPSTILTGGIDWFQTEPTDPQIWNSVTGTGLTGSYVEPVDPFSYVLANDTGYFGFQVSAFDLDGNIGLLAPNGSLVLCICADINTGTLFAEAPVIMTAEEYFSSYVGSVPLDPDMMLMIEGTGDSGMAHFELTSFTIAIVPEPATGVLMGLGLAGLFLRRRRA